MCEIHIPIAPQRRALRRPRISRKRIAGTVKTTLTIPITPVARREVVVALRPRESKIVGALWLLAKRGKGRGRETSR
jgi:hypothetical protein